MTPAGLPREAAAAYIGASVSTLEKLVREGKAPKPRQLSKGRSVWLTRELDELLEALPVSEIAPGPGRRKASR